MNDKYNLCPPNDLYPFIDGLKLILYNTKTLNEVIEVTKDIRYIGRTK